MEDSQEKKKTRKTRQSSKDKDTKSKKTPLKMDGVNIGDHITYDVLRMILEYSNIRDLTTAALVCRSWNEAATKEIQTRLRPQHILHKYGTKKKKQEPHEVFADELHIKPNIALLFVGNDCAISDNPDCMCHHINSLKDHITVHNYSLVHDNKTFEGDIVTGLFLPKIPGVEMRCFNISVDEVEHFRRTTRQINLDKMAKNFCKISHTEDNIKAVILFTSSEHEEEHADYSDDAKQILKTFLSRRTDGKGSPVSIWGGITSNVVHCRSARYGFDCDYPIALAGISICGPGISTWSVVLDSRIKTKAQVEKELTSFRDSIKLQKYSVGLMFACVARGEEWFSEKNVEPKIFKKLFPNVPLVGSYGDGEFGVTTVPQESSKIDGGITYEYSTIFLILSYGSLRNIVK